MDELRRLARAHGVQTEYLDVNDKRQEAPDESLLLVLQCLGVPIQRPDQAGELLRELARERELHWLEPAYALWQDEPMVVTTRCLVSAGTEVHCRLELEDGLTQSFTAEVRNIGSRSQPRCAVPVDVPLPAGYHRLRMEMGGRSAETLLLVAPPQAYTQQPGERPRNWGLFLPIYALRRDTSWGAGDFADLEAFVEWTCRQGGRLVATLPLLASFFDYEADPSPYTPASRLFWNEFYLAIQRLPEYQACRAAQQLVESSDFQAALQPLRESRTVQYAPLMQAKRQVLEAMAEEFFARATPRRETFEHFVQFNSDAEPYARFRAACEKLGRPWTQWPSGSANDPLPADAYDDQARRYHLFVQWLVDEQLGELAGRCRDWGAAWYLDLPLGVHPDGYDVWKYRDSFAMQASGGAPPDAFFTRGQSWGFPPLHPERLRADGYQYLIRVIRHHLRYAGLLRIDHVMGLHRLYWVPQGVDATRGAYVRYQADELYAVLSIESHRQQARIIGENLGTVPPEVNEAMDRRRLGRLYVAQYELNDPDKGLPEPSANEVASLNTHDMPTFVSFWKGLDIADRVDLGLMTDEEATEEEQRRGKLRKTLLKQLVKAGLLAAPTEDPIEVLRALVVWQGHSASEVVLVNLEDAWLEESPQNTPGTVTERVNWRQKARYRMDEFAANPAVLDLLRALDSARRGDIRSTSP